MPAVRSSAPWWIAFLETWLDRWLAAVPGLCHVNAAEVIRIGL